MDAEKLSVVAEPSSEKNGKPDPNNAEFGDEIDEKGPGQDEANENTVIESDEIDNDLTRSIQETGHEDNDQIVDKAVVETAINYLVRYSRKQVLCELLWTKIFRPPVMEIRQKL